MGCSHSAKQYKQDGSKQHSLHAMYPTGMNNYKNNKSNSTSGTTTTTKYTPELLVDDNRPTRITVDMHNDDSLCCYKTNKLNQHFNNYDFNPSIECCDEYEAYEPTDNNLEENQNKSNKLQSSTDNIDTHEPAMKQVIPAIMEPNWLLSNEIQLSSLLKRRQQAITVQSDKQQQ